MRHSPTEIYAYVLSWERKALSRFFVQLLEKSSSLLWLSFFDFNVESFLYRCEMEMSPCEVKCCDTLMLFCQETEGEEAASGLRWEWSIVERRKRYSQKVEMGNARYKSVLPPGGRQYMD